MRYVDVARGSRLTVAALVIAPARVQSAEAPGSHCRWWRQVAPPRGLVPSMRLLRERTHLPQGGLVAASWAVVPCRARHRCKWLLRATFATRAFARLAASPKKFMIVCHRVGRNRTYQG